MIKEEKKQILVENRAQKKNRLPITLTRLLLRHETKQGKNVFNLHPENSSERLQIKF